MIASGGSRKASREDHNEASRMDASYFYCCRNDSSD
jgi:hypothetical protein